MAFAFPSLLSRNVLHSSAKNIHLSFPYIKLNFGSPLKTAINSLKFQHTSKYTVARTVRNTAYKEKTGISFLLKGATIAGVGLGLANQRNSIIYCDEPQVKPKPTPFVYPEERGPPPTSSVSLYELGFGTVAGLCAGVFVKKGAKAMAWFLGGIFVLLQYLGSTSLIRVNWTKMSSRFESMFHSNDPATGASRPPNVLSLWNWLIDFLTADFQPRASFVAGFALGLRVG
ncbi:hypothetical protein BDN70DRAFT_246158 [Pholiota conissans]|uniref:FUN14 family protein n=1 Tax=Pholiota conissans TaxID=109636 RepID=A0A9P5ZBM5_9AGAR|nr:hypothetical protein BDN70DRAFT_246158 [Pholiota conissans]